MKANSTENTVQKQYNHLSPFQWKGGISGNPNGRPKGSRNMSTVFQSALDVLVESNTVTTGWETIEQQMVQKQIEKALQGDTRAFEVIMDRRYGKPKQCIEMTEILEQETLTANERADLERVQRVLAGISGGVQ